MIPIHDDNPTRRRPVVTVALIATCILVYLWQATLDPRAAQAAVYSFGFIPAVVLGDRTLPAELAVLPGWSTLITSMFLHGGFMHLAGNMLYLWVFGNNIEDACGHVRFVVFYLACGLAAAFTQALPDPASVVPMIGASGAISGVLGAYLVLFPHARVHVIIPIGFFLMHHRLRAGWLLGFWFLLQLLSGVMGASAEGGVAFWAHVGGFVAGIGLIFPFRDRRFTGRRWGRTGRPPRRGRSRIPSSTGRRSGPWS
jgi:membrane associated rhomboid family serine protease